jgi:hypothetical protein
MVVILVHNAATGQMQLITEGCDQGAALQLMEQAVRQIRQQTGGLPTPAGPPPQPPKPRPRNVRETITFPPKAPGTQ